MRKFRYIESGHGDDSLSNHETNELDVDFDIQVDGYYALMPVTKAEFNLLRDLNNMDWKRDEYKLPGYDPTAEVPVDRPGVYPKKPSAEKSWGKTWKLADDIPEPTKTIQPDGSVKLSSVVAERFMRMDMDICEFIRQEVEKEVKAELDRRGFEDSGD